MLCCLSSATPTSALRRTQEYYDWRDIILMVAPLMEGLGRTVGTTISARLATAEMVMFGVPQALFKLLGRISLYSFVLTVHLAFVIYHSTKSSSDDARGSRKPKEPGVSTHDYRVPSIRLLSGVLGVLVSPHNQEDTAFGANILLSRSRTSTTSSEIARHSSSNTSVATLVEQTNPSKEAADAHPTKPVPTKKHGTIFPDSQWATMNATQIRRIRRAVKRVQYKEEHGAPPREVKSKASKATKSSKKNKENTRENDQEHELEIGEEHKQGGVKDNDKESQDDKEDDQESVKEKHNEGIDDDDTDDNDEGFAESFTKDDKGIEEDVTLYDKESIEEDFTKEDDEIVMEGATVGDNEFMDDDNGAVEECFTGDNEDVKESVTEDDHVNSEGELTEDHEVAEEDVTEVDNERVEKDITEDDHERVEESVTVDGNERVDEDVTEDDYESVEENVAVDDNERVEENVTEDDYKHAEENVPEEHDEVVNEDDNEDDNEGHAKTAAYGPCKFTPPTHHHTLRQRNGIIMIPSLIKGWPPVLLSKPIIDRLDPIDFKIMQLECEYHLSRQKLHSDRFVERDGESRQRAQHNIGIFDLAGEYTMEEVDLP